MALIKKQSLIGIDAKDGPTGFNLIMFKVSGHAIALFRGCISATLETIQKIVKCETLESFTWVVEVLCETCDMCHKLCDHC